VLPGLKAAIVKAEGFLAEHPKPEEGDKISWKLTAAEYKLASEGLKEALRRAELQYEEAAKMAVA
jgi:hypothetical protein